MNPFVFAHILAPFLSQLTPRNQSILIKKMWPSSEMKKYEEQKKSGEEGLKEEKEEEQKKYEWEDEEEQKKYEWGDEEEQKASEEEEQKKGWDEGGEKEDMAPNKVKRSGGPQRVTLRFDESKKVRRAMKINFIRSVIGSLITSIIYNSGLPLQVPATSSELGRRWRNDPT